MVESVWLFASCYLLIARMHKFWETPLTAADAPQGAKVPESVRIGNVRISPATILAPMAGVTDTVFRRFIRNASFVRSASDIMLPPDAVRQQEQNNNAGSDQG